MRAEGFFCSLDVPYGGLGISKLQFFILKKYIKNFRCIFFKFLVIKTQDPEPDLLEMIDLDPDPDSMNPDIQHWQRLKEPKISYPALSVHQLMEVEGKWMLGWESVSVYV